MRLALISDTHMAAGSWPLPFRCCELIGASDLVVHAGDITTVEGLAAIQEIGPPVRAVAGNMDSPALQAQLPEVDEIEVEGAVIAVVHDAGRSEGRLERLKDQFPRADAVVFGHTHEPLNQQTGGFQIFNPGSPTDPRLAPRPTMGLAEVTSGQVQFELISLD